MEWNLKKNALSLSSMRQAVNSKQNIIGIAMYLGMNIFQA